MLLHSLIYDYNNTMFHLFHIVSSYRAFSKSKWGLKLEPGVTFIFCCSKYMHVMTLPRVLTPAAVASLAQTQQFQNAVILQYNTYLSMCHRFNRKSSNRRERKMYLGIDYKQRWLYYSGYYSPSWSIGKGNTNCWKVEKSVDLWTTLQQLHAYHLL